MRQWQIQLAEDLERHKDNPIFCDLLEQSTRAIQNKIKGMDTSNFTLNEWNMIIEECYSEIINDHN